MVYKLTIRAMCILNGEQKLLIVNTSSYQLTNATVKNCIKKVYLFIIFTVLYYY